jgi:hypothetical protein
MRVGNGFGENRDDRIAADVGATESDLACASSTTPQAFASRPANQFSRGKVSLVCAG